MVIALSVVLNNAKELKKAFPMRWRLKMEATPIAQTYQFNVPFVVVGAVSDLANGEAEMSFEAFRKTSCIIKSNC